MIRTVVFAILLALATPAHAQFTAGQVPTAAGFNAALAQLYGTNNVRVAGAKGDGTTVDLGALTSAAAAGPAFLPAGTYYTGASIGALSDGRWYSAGGSGRLAFREAGAVMLGAPNVSIITSAPTTGAGYSDDGQTTAFNADISGIHLAAATRITGATTLGNLTTGFRLNPLAAMIYLNAANASGMNYSTSINDGRTQVAQIYLRGANNGGGDFKGIFCNQIVTGVRSGATNWLASPGIGCLGGQIYAGADHVFLQGIGDINLDDNGHDASGIPIVVNMFRSVGTAALDDTWMGVRAQSKGSVAVDAFFSGSGRAKIGLDLTGGIFQSPAGAATHAAMATGAGALWYGNAVNADTTHFSNFTTIGTESFGYAGSTGWTATVGDVPILQAAAAGVSVTQLRITTPSVPASASSACAKGQVAYDSSYLYLCVATDTWKRAALATW
jgi:hypothetical protein